MSRRAFAEVEKSFAGEATSAFSFLVSECGMTGPEFQGVVLPVVAFVGKGVRYRIMLDSDDKAVMTRVEMEVATRRLVADLENLVQAAGLGARNHVAHSVPNLNGMRHALESQARYVRLLQPYMKSDDSIELMRRANAREWNLQ